ncbi:autophagy-related protein 16 [Xylariomycetidae sp. FL0641]|nr:autophagy-related protein 16 [Xylariomycetidae sp. FL0641]
MPSLPAWRDDYLADLREGASSSSDAVSSSSNRDLVDACSQLADRVAELEAGGGGAQHSTTPGASSTDAGAALAEALRAREALAARLRAADAELARLRARAREDARRVEARTAERDALAARLRDRSEELVGKNKLLKDVQDDNLTLNIQLDVTEQKAAKVQAENKELIDRWMKRMGHEAEAMNLQNETPGSHR